ncbi:MAG: sigma-54-dependent Fis family transcriptional regulator, partial [Kiritimatiellae bacterium]|nr:sigma-54-dependent Fis family transcriptional regulator [Kiritimatiellia bacterium]
MKPKILIVDDEKPLRDTLARWFKTKYECLTAPDAAEAMKLIGENPDLALMISDVRMPGENGVELVRKAKAANPTMGCILLTAYGTVDLAVEAMKDGADDFFQKPVTDLDQFELRVAKAIKTASLEKEVRALKSRLNENLENFTGKSPAMEKVYALIRKAAPANANVLIEGPSGTGKELVAQAIQSLSRRKDRPFVVLNCAALPEALVESELFGHEKGAFT